MPVTGDVTNPASTLSLLIPGKRTARKEGRKEGREGALLSPSPLSPLLCSLPTDGEEKRPPACMPARLPNAPSPCARCASDSIARFGDFNTAVFPLFSNPPFNDNVQSDTLPAAAILLPQICWGGSFYLFTCWHSTLMSY